MLPIILFLFLAVYSNLEAQQPAQAVIPPETRISRPSVLDEDPSNLLGMDLQAVSVLFGFPDAVFSVRGDEPWQDDVVFRYSQGYSFFWYRDRIWQIRFDGNYRGSVFGLFKGNGKDKALSLLGEPLYLTDDSLIFELPDRGYPVRLRIVFASLKGRQAGDASLSIPPIDPRNGTPEGFASDFYLYRADF